MRQYWLAPIPPFHIADGGGALGAAAITDVSPAPSIVIPANALEIASRMEFSVFGRWTSAVTPGTAIVGIYIGAASGAISAAVAVGVSSTLTLAASQTNRTFRIEGDASVRTVGSGTSATIIGCMEITNVTGATGVVNTDMAPATAPATVAFDSTIANKLMVGITPSVTTQSWTTHFFGVRLVN